MIIKSKILSKLAIVNNCDKLYYKNGTSPLSDYEYDILKQELLDLYKKDASVFPKEHRLFKVGTSVDTSKSTKQHKYQMYSLDNIFTESEFIFWSKRGNNYVTSYKLDGCAVSLEYRNNKLLHILSRGNGKIGEDITHLKKLIYDIPDIFPHDCIHGEIIITKNNFRIVNRYRKRKKLPVYKNLRNAVAGLLNLKVYDRNLKNCLQFYAYRYFPQKEALYSKSLEYLVSQNVNTIPYVKYSKAKIPDYYASINKNNLDYDIDGIVIALDEKEICDSLGYTRKYPKFAIAWKLSKEATASKLLGVDFTIGRTGKITAVASIEPIKIDNVTIKKVTLSISDIVNNDIWINDILYIIRSGDVIPKVVLTEKGKDRYFITFPTHCEKCNADITFKHINSTYTLSSKCRLECPNISKPSFQHFVSQKGLNIKGIGKQLIHKLVDGQLLVSKEKQYSIDIFNFKNCNHIKNLIGTKTFNKIVQNIEHVKRSLTIGKFIKALGIPKLNYKIYENIDKYKFKELRTISEKLDSGVSAKAFKDFCHSKYYTYLLERIRRYNLNI